MVVLDNLYYNLIPNSNVVIFYAHSNIKNNLIHILFLFKMIPILMDIINGFISLSEMHKPKSNTNSILSIL